MGCIRCGEDIIGDGTEDGDDVICRECKGDISYEMLVEDEE